MSDGPRANRRHAPNTRGRRELVVYAIFALTSLSLILLPDHPRRVLASHVADVALYPFRRVATTVRSLHDLREQNRRLSESIEAMRLESERTAEIRRENRRLRGELGFSQVSALRVVGCEILAVGGGRLGDRTLLLDRGYQHGIRRDMPISCRTGLAGKVFEVGPETSRALLLTHRLSAVSVRDRRSRVVGIVQWNPGTAQGLKLGGVSYLADVAAGDTLVTSGLGGVFPAGLSVGVVESVGGEASGLLLDVDVSPTVDLTRLEEVFALVESHADSVADTVVALPSDGMVELE